jgi:gluconolactonase
VDTEGDVWSSVASAQQPSVCAYAPDGRELGCIAVPEVPSNVAFGRGAERSTLYITARTGLYRVQVGRAGYHLPPTT